MNPVRTFPHNFFKYVPPIYAYSSEWIVTILSFQSIDVGTATGPSVEAPDAVTNTKEEQSISAAELLLPKDVTPSYYRLRLDPYLEDAGPDGRNFTYKGHVSITIQCHNTTNKVSVHAKNLDIGEDIKIAVVNVTVATTTALTPVSAAPAGSSATTETGSYSTPSSIFNNKNCNNSYCLCVILIHLYQACTIQCQSS
jgi:hypothetical protein